MTRSEFKKLEQVIAIERVTPTDLLDSGYFDLESQSYSDMIVLKMRKKYDLGEELIGKLVDQLFNLGWRNIESPNRKEIRKKGLRLL